MGVRRSPTSRPQNSAQVKIEQCRHLLLKSSTRVLVAHTCQKDMRTPTKQHTQANIRRTRLYAFRTSCGVPVRVRNRNAFRASCASGPSGSLPHAAEECSSSSEGMLRVPAVSLFNGTELICPTPSSPVPNHQLPTRRSSRPERSSPAASRHSHRPSHPSP